MRFHFTFSDAFRFLDLLQDDPARAAMGLFCFLAICLVLLVFFSFVRGDKRK